MTEIPSYLRRPHLSDYVHGFFFAIILTVIPFYAIAFTHIERTPALVMVAVLALIQMLVHLRFFVHYSTRRVPFEATAGMALAVFIVIVVAGGGIWVMTDLHYRMMP